MKRIILIITMVWGIITSALGQQAGLKVGGNMSKQNDNQPDINYTYKPGYQIGIWYRQPIKKKWSFGTELSFLASVQHQ